MPTKKPSLEWLNERSTGVLLHPTSLPDPNGIGTLNESAKRFIDFLYESEIVYWQVLPIGPTGFGDSPYQSFSAFAGNPYLIDLEPLCNAGILEPKDLDILRHLPANYVDFGTLYKTKWPILRLAYKNFAEGKRAYVINYGLFDEFCETHKEWLEPFSGYMALKDAFGGKFWGEWPPEYRTIGSAMKQPLWNKTETARKAHAFFQYLFFGQWNIIKEYANKRGIEIIGDMPIFVALDSADVWANPDIFLMEKPGQPDVVAGVPPDYFSETGQLWGNPLYNWETLKKSKYSWWMKRFEMNFQLYDVVRLDHFRGFHNYWEIPADAKDARSGVWKDGPCHDFFNTVAKTFPKAAIIAEDLGEIDDGVRKLRDDFGLPGMAILQFAFDCNGNNLYLPHNLKPNSVIYPGTHDNNTTIGWYENASEEQRDQIRRYFRVSGEDIAWDVIRAAYASVSNLAVIPMQDLLALDESDRMNIPGSEQGNWQWRLSHNQLETIQQTSQYLRELAWLYAR